VADPPIDVVVRGKRTGRIVRGTRCTSWPAVRGSPAACPVRTSAAAARPPPSAVRPPSRRDLVPEPERRTWAAADLSPELSFRGLQTNRWRVTTPCPMTPPSQVEMTADLEVVGDVVTGQPQRHQELAAVRPERAPSSQLVQRLTKAHLSRLHELATVLDELVTKHGAEAAANDSRDRRAMQELPAPAGRRGLPSTPSQPHYPSQYDRRGGASRVSRLGPWPGTYSRNAQTAA
jgi:hypothetical protein